MPVFDVLPDMASDVTWLTNYWGQRPAAETLAGTVPLLHSLEALADGLLPQLLCDGLERQQEGLDPAANLDAACVWYPGRVRRWRGPPGGFDPGDESCPKIVFALDPAEESKQSGKVVYTGVHAFLHHIPENQLGDTSDYIRRSTEAFGPQNCFVVPPWPQVPPFASNLWAWLNRLWNKLCKPVCRWFGYRSVPPWRIAMATHLACYFRKVENWWDKNPDERDPERVYDVFKEDKFAWTFEVRLHSPVRLRHLSQWSCSDETWDDFLRDVNELPASLSEDEDYKAWQGRRLPLVNSADYVNEIQQWARKQCQHG